MGRLVQPPHPPPSTRAPAAGLVGLVGLVGLALWMHPFLVPSACSGARLHAQLWSCLWLQTPTCAPGVSACSLSSSAGL